MITTCASLIVVNFALLLAFEVESFLVKVTPQFFFVISAALSIVSDFPVKRKLYLEITKSIEASYDYWMRWKLIWHYAGFTFFIAGLLAIAITGLLEGFLKN